MEAAKFKNIVCHICLKTFPYQSRLKEHMEVHKSHEEKYTCKVCKKVFKGSKNLKQHVRIHDENRA